MMNKFTLKKRVDMVFSGLWLLIGGYISLFFFVISVGFSSVPCLWISLGIFIISLLGSVYTYQQLKKQGQTKVKKIKKLKKKKKKKVVVVEDEDEDDDEEEDDEEEPEEEVEEDDDEEQRKYELLTEE